MNTQKSWEQTLNSNESMQFIASIEKEINEKLSDEELKKIIEQQSETN